MALNMFLTARMTIGGNNYDSEVSQLRHRQLMTTIGLDATDLKYAGLNTTVSVYIGYWRQVNAIHKWFIDNVQDGKDDCREYRVSREKLMELLLVCSTALTTKNATVLPPHGGFLFGSTTIDAEYWNDLTQTLVMLTFILNNPKFKNMNFYYQASW
jgi:hypothetical protein